MFYKNLITEVNGKKVIYLYLNSDYEVSNDLYVRREKNKFFINRARDYLNNMGIDYRGKSVYLVVDNIVVGKIQLNKFFKKPKYLEYTRFGKKYRFDFLNEEEHPSLKFIDIYRSSGIVDKLKFNEYLFGVIAREMPYIDSSECLKAQAVLARTYLFKCLKENKEIKDINRYQLFFDKSYLMLLWKDKYDEYRDKILDAIIDTNKEVLTFHGNFIECFSHFQNSGKTEDARNVLKLSYPYLVSVNSLDNLTSPVLRSRRVDNTYLSKLLKVDISPKTEVSIIRSTSGNNVLYIKFGNKVFDGLILSRTLGLISNHFTVQIHDNYTLFLTRGCGHGLGLSKCGAKVMADSGYDYKRILDHYYPNTELRKIKEEKFF